MTLPRLYAFVVTRCQLDRELADANDERVRLHTLLTQSKLLRAADAETIRDLRRQVRSAQQWAIALEQECADLRAAQELSEQLLGIGGEPQ